MPLTLDQARRELRELRASMPYAYAMGHGCTIGGAHPTLQAIRDREATLRAIIAEHTPEDAIKA